MELLQLHYFLEVAQSEHVTRSARKLRIAQPALTQSIHRLEHELGVELFEHVGRNIRLTPAGAHLQQRLTPALAVIDDLKRGLAVFSESEQHLVRVDIQSASGIVIDAIALYGAAHPDARFSVSQNTHDAPHDLCVTTRMPDSSYHGIDGRATATAFPLASFTERIAIAVPAAGNFPSDSIELGALRDERFISLAGSRAFRSLCDLLCGEAGFRAHTAFESDNPSVVKKMIGIGLGVGFWPEHSWNEPGGDGVRLARLADARFERTITLLQTTPNPSEEARRFGAFLIDYMERIWMEQPL